MVGRGDKNIEAIAAEWVIRLGGEKLSEVEQVRLQRWLRESPAHAAAFECARSAWAELTALKAVPGSLVEDVLAVHNSPRIEHAAIPSRTLRRGLSMLAVAVFLGGGLGAFWFGNPLLMLEADYRTGPGESRTVTLADGSQVQLGTETALAIHFDGQERRVELLSGEAYFTVAPMRGSETRPFVVRSANGTTKALGTQFMAERLDDGTEIVAAEHRIQVSTDNGVEPVVLSPGQAVHYDRLSGLGAVTAANLDQATAWRRGSLIFDKVPLSDVVAELNRYRRGRIVIANTTLAMRRVSGVFEIADLDGALASITRELGVQSSALPPFVTVLY